MTFTEAQRSYLLLASGILYTSATSAAAAIPQGVPWYVSVILGSVGTGCLFIQKYLSDEVKQEKLQAAMKP